MLENRYRSKDYKKEKRELFTLILVLFLKSNKICIRCRR